MNQRPPIKLRTLESFEYRRLQAILRRVRLRWRLRVLLRGLALLAVAALVTVSAAAWGVDAARYRGWVVLLLGVAMYGGLAYAAYRFVWRPLSRRVTDREVALYVEENAELRAGLLSAVEFGALEGRAIPPEVSEQFVAKIVQDAVQRGRQLDYGKGVETRELRRVGGYLAAAILTVAAVVLVNPAFLRQGLPALFRPFAGAEVETPYSIAVTPGSIDIARGSDQVLGATLAGFDSDNVEVSYRIGTGEWERMGMTPNPETGRHELLLLRIAAEVEYFVEASSVRSEVHRLGVVDRPYVESVDVELSFPAYSGLSPLTIEDGGDIAALAGTVASLRVTPTVAVGGARILFEDAAAESDAPPSAVIDLTPADGAFVGRLTVETAGFYRVEFRTPSDEWVEGSSDYVVEVLADQPPTITIDRPGRDVDVTTVEEVFTEVSVEDDFGIEGVELVWALNGLDEQRVSLLAPPPSGSGRRKGTASHTFFLEEFDLEPGDFIAYWAEARDNRTVGDSQVSVTDMYFVEVRPFEREFTQADSGGGGGGGGGGGAGPMGGMAEQQRQVVAATFKLVRDGDLAVGGPGRVGDDQDDAEFLAGIEVGLQERAREAQANVGSLGDAEQSMTALEYLDKASDALGRAAQQLREHNAAEAMAPEQEALRYLQRVEAMARRVEMSMGQEPGGDGGAGGMEDIADMFDLEMDELENQYESVRRGQQEQADDAVDEALQRLTELSRRQQQEIERQRANQAQGGGGGGRNDSQRALADEAEELARELQRLSRENSRPDLQDTANRLQQAADAMRRAAAQNGQSSTAEGTRALNELQDARRLLDRMREGRLERDLAQAQDQIADMRQQQAQIEQEVERLGQQGGRTDERIEGLMRRKDALAGDLVQLESDLDSMARESRSDQLRASRELQEAANSMRDDKLADKVRYSKGVVQQRDPRYAAGFESEISDDLAVLEGRIAAAEGAISRSEADRLAGAIDDTRDLVRRLESLEERGREATEGGEPGEGPPGEQPGPAGEGPAGEGPAGQEAGQGADGQGAQGAEGNGGTNPPQGRGQPSQPGASRLGGSGSGVPRGQVGRELRERLADAEALRDQLEEQGIQVTDLDPVIGALRDLDEDFVGTTRGLDELRDDVIEGLKRFEFWLNRLADASNGQRPQLAGSDRVPEGYRELVEAYFRALARQEDEEQR